MPAPPAKALVSLEPQTPWVQEFPRASGFPETQGFPKPLPSPSALGYCHLSLFPLVFGWMYKVNGWFPNYGCSRYQLKEGDTIEWVYTCDLGVDVGGFYSTGG